MALPWPAAANLPGGGTGTGPNVTVTDNGDGTVTMANGIVSIVIVKATSRLNSILYTYNNGTPKTTQMLLGAGEYYYGGFMLGDQTYVYSLATDPASNGGEYADIALLSSTATAGVMETHFSMLRGSQGFYSTAIMTHRSQDAAFGVTAWGVVTRVPAKFNWLSADPARNFLLGVQTTTGVKTPNSPHEITINLDGSQAGEYQDKFFYAQDHIDQKAWGWSSVGAGGSNAGMWIMTQFDFSDGGPLKRDVGTYAYNVLNNSILTGELGMGSDGNLAAGELWTKTCGPWFIYVNNVSDTITDATQASQALFSDAVAQAAAENAAWPYPWFTNPNYVQASGRGTVTGTLLISDPGGAAPALAGTWVGLEEQPTTSTATYDFQKWLKPYQFWTQTDANGNFSLPNVLAGSNYTLWAYGPGGAGTFLSQNQTGGNPPLLYTLPATPFAVNVTGGGTTNLGAITWSPTRVGSTVFELGFPDRKAGEFRHGEDYWTPDLSPQLGYPTPVWGMQMEFPVDFPNGLTYTVGESRWDTDWNYVLPSLPDQTGKYQPCTGTIQFNLAATPAAGAEASIYLGCAGDDGGNVIISVNGANLGTASGVTATPNAIGAKGFNPAYGDDSSIHCSDHGPFSDERITFPGSLLHAGQNTLTIDMNATGLTAYLMVDYLRLELTGYVPPAPASVTVYAGNNSNLVTWPVAPGATGYNILRSTVSGSGYVSLPGEQLAPVSGSDTSIATYTDTTAINGTSYYYVVQSYNPTGTSAVSPESAVALPSAGFAASAPPAPTGLTVTSSGHHSVALSWDAAPGADYYSVSRATLYSNGNGGANTLRTIVLNDATAATTFTDTTPTDGKTYGYAVQAISAAGASGPSAAVMAEPLPPPPAAAPGGLTGTALSGNTSVSLSWSPVPGATGYVIYRSTQYGGPFTFPANFVTALLETSYADAGLATNHTYYYQVTAVNVGGISAPASTAVSAGTPSVPAITSALSASAQAGQPFTYQITGTNAPTSFGASGLPAGLSVNAATGLISGMATQAGTATVSLTATNAGGTGGASLTLVVTPAAVLAPVITSATNALAQINEPFTYQITATNSPASFGANGLPAGLSVNATGLISGAATQTGSFPVGLTATNSGGTGTATLLLTVSLAPVQPPVITSAASADVQTGTFFSYQITASNAPTRFTAGLLPVGLTVNGSTGLISGVTAAVGTYTVPLGATNAGGTGTATLTLAVSAAPAVVPVITSAASATTQVGVGFNYHITASNSPVSFTASGLPAGLSVNASTGLIAGTPAAAGTYAIVLSATNGSGTGTAALALTVSPAPIIAPVITSAPTAGAQEGQSFSFQVTASNAPASYNASGLPQGLTINPANGLISGTPTQVGTFSVGLSAVNSAGTGNGTLNLTVLAGLPVATLTATPPTSVVTGSGDVGLLTVTLSSPQASDVTVRYTIKGTAVNGTDYVLLSGHKKIKAGRTSKSIKVIPTGDLGGASKKTVKLTLQPGDGYMVTDLTPVKIKLLAPGQ